VLLALKANPNQLVLDLGTGSGCIAISIAKNSPATSIIASDVSGNALEVAQANAKFHKVEGKIEFIQSNLLEKIDVCPDIIVTNLPYIPTQRIAYLDSSVKDFEPHLAIDGGDDGFFLYEKLFLQLKQKALSFKLLVGEIDYTHGELAANSAQAYFPNAEIEIKKDLAHAQRILTIRQ
ncbi:MAG: tRNA (adenine(22)-N(1))-methyltransferase TrmK, partial [Candidatus Daviesbacteria bacterium]|nr:tRNA (adenine(22)-N(1))-methyltransferase TrmK [Candidatus Daviesbacteria bacterium]